MICRYTNLKIDLFINIETRLDKERERERDKDIDIYMYIERK